MNKLILKSTIRVDKKPNSSSKIWTLCDSFPCELEFLYVVEHQHGSCGEVQVRNHANGKLWIDSTTRISKVLSKTEYGIVK